MTDFATKASTEEARELLFSGAETDDQKKRAVDAFMLLLGNLIAEGVVPEDEAAERLSLAQKVRASV